MKSTFETIGNPQSAIKALNKGTFLAIAKTELTYLQVTSETALAVSAVTASLKTIKAWAKDNNINPDEYCIHQVCGNSGYSYKYDL